MEHERFVKLVNEKAFNQRGALRPLAVHVRQLYGVIRQLQEDDNSFWYIAEVIQRVRGNQIDPEDFMTRVKTYFHRDRKALGDALVTRGSRRLVELQRKEKSAADRPAARLLSRREKDGAASETVERSDGGNGQGAGDEPQPFRTERAGQDVKVRSSNDRRNLTAAQQRPGTRRISPGG